MLGVRYLVRLSGALASFALGACLRLLRLPCPSLGSPWFTWCASLVYLVCLRLLLPLAPFASGFPLAYAGLFPPSLMPGGALSRCSLLLSPRFTRGSVTIVGYNQSSALQGIAYNLAVWCNGSPLQRGTS